jgi:hypothetical protein
VATKPDWERLEEESEKAYAAFCVYRDLGVERSLVVAWQTLHREATRAPGYWHDWSARFRWVARAALYDDYLDAERRRIRERVRNDLLERQFRFEMAHQARLEQLVGKMEETAVEAMDATIRACQPPVPPPPADPLLEALQLDADGNPLPPPKLPKLSLVKVNVSGLARFIQELRNAAREASCGVWPLPTATRDSDDAKVTTRPEAEIAWVKPADSADQ